MSSTHPDSDSVVTGARTALQSAESRRSELEATFEAMADGVFVYDTDGRIVGSNTAIRTLLGLDAEPEYANLSFSERAMRLDIRDENAERVAPEMLPPPRAMRGEDVTGENSMDLRMHTLDGRDIQVSVSASAIRDSHGDVTGAVAVYRDVTERRRLERRVIAERDRLQSILDTLPEAVVIADAAGRYEMVNKAAEDILGMDMTGVQIPVDEAQAFDMLGARQPDGSPHPSESMPLVRSIFYGEEVYAAQVTVYNRLSDREIPLLVNSVPLRDQEGRIAGAISVFQDISPLKSLEHARIEFLMAASHELKTPLTSIRGFAQLAQQSLALTPVQRSEQISKYLQTIIRTSGTMARLVDDLLDFTRLQMGLPLLLHRRTTDVVALVRGVIDRQRLPASHRIIVDAAEPVLMARVDGPRIERVVANLLNNAVKYSPRGGDITVRARLQGEQAVISVHDQGIGIPEADVTHIFERFYRGENVVGHIEGAGIGLANAQQIVVAHGGGMDVDSAEGRGSTFTVRLPAVTSDVLIPDDSLQR